MKPLFSAENEFRVRLRTSSKMKIIRKCVRKNGTVFPATSRGTLWLGALTKSTTPPRTSIHLFRNRLAVLTSFASLWGVVRYQPAWLSWLASSGPHGLWTCAKSMLKFMNFCQIYADLFVIMDSNSCVELFDSDDWPRTCAAGAQPAREAVGSTHPISITYQRYLEFFEFHLFLCESVVQIWPL